MTKHLAVLADAGLVRSVKTGRERLWEFEPRELESARQALDLISRPWDAALDRLRLAAEGPDEAEPCRESVGNSEEMVTALALIEPNRVLKTDKIRPADAEEKSPRAALRAA